MKIFVHTISIVACYTVTVKNTDEAIDDDDFPVLMQVCQKHRHEKGTLCNGINLTCRLLSSLSKYHLRMLS